MSPFWLGFLAGVFIGCNLAILALGLCLAARRNRPREIGREEIARMKGEA